MSALEWATAAAASLNDSGGRLMRGGSCEEWSAGDSNVRYWKLRADDAVVVV